jgi:hypothetical protein
LRKGVAEEVILRPRVREKVEFLIGNGFQLRIREKTGLVVVDRGSQLRQHGVAIAFRLSASVCGGLSPRLVLAPGSFFFLLLSGVFLEQIFPNGSVVILRGIVLILLFMGALEWRLCLGTEIGLNATVVLFARMTHTDIL